MNMNPNLESHSVHYGTHQAAHSPPRKTHGDNCPHIGYLDNIQSERLVDGLDKDNNYFDSVDNNSLLVVPSVCNADLRTQKGWCFKKYADIK